MGIQAMLFNPTEITNMIYLNFFFKEKRILVIQAMAENAHDIFWSFSFILVVICGGVFGELHLSWCCVCVWCCICGEGGGSVECNS